MDKEKEMKFAIYNKYYEGEITSEDRDALLKGVRPYLESNAMDRYTDKALSDRKLGLHEIKSTIKHEVLNPKYKNKKDSLKKIRNASRKVDNATYRYNLALQKDIDSVDPSIRKHRFDDPEAEQARREHIRARKAGRLRAVNKEM